MNEEFNWSNAPTICELNGYRWLLGQEAEETLSWNDAVEWCKSIGGVLPPREVLLMAYLNQETVEGFAHDLYWSSSEDNSHPAWHQNFNNGNQSYYLKNGTFRVCAVRCIKLGE